MLGKVFSTVDEDGATMSFCNEENADWTDSGEVMSHS